MQGRSGRAEWAGVSKSREQSSLKSSGSLASREHWAYVVHYQAENGQGFIPASRETESEQDLEELAAGWWLHADSIAFYQQILPWRGGSKRHLTSYCKVQNRIQLFESAARLKVHKL